MPTQKIHYGHLSGEVLVPASKSVLQRALAAALLAKGESRIFRLSESKDCLAALDIIQKLGAETERDSDSLWVFSRGVQPRQGAIHCGESGLALRMFASIAALSGRELLFTGEGSLLKRPISFFKDYLPLFGVKADTQWGYLPMQLSGKLQGANARVDGSQSSQYLTGLLMALACCDHDSEIAVQQLNSIPYINLTISVLQSFGIAIEHHRYQTFFVRGAQQYKAQQYTTEGDWSGAAFWLVAGALGGDVTVRGLNPLSAQADKAVLQALEQCGAIITQPNSNSYKIEKGDLAPFEFDATHCPDLFPPLVALAAHCSGKSRIYGVSRLYDKESNRALALQQEFAKMGVSIDLSGDKMMVTGGKIQSAALHSHHDHRIAMAVAIAALGVPVQIEEAQAVDKSYPQFWEQLQAIG